MYEVNHNEPPPDYEQNHVTHTFSHRASCSQVFAYIIIFSDIAVYYSCIHFLYENWILFGVYTFSAFMVFLTTGFASCSDPTDRIVYEYKWSRFKRQSFTQNISDCYYCEYCDSYCQESSKHCKVCNRCVNNFDHHCIWINNCIGDNNYKYFMAMILSTLSHIIIFLIAASIMSTISDITSQEKISRAIPVWVLMPILSVLGFLLLNLVFLHIYLQCRGLTTYSFMMERRKQDQQQALERQKSQQRVRQAQADITHQKINVKSKVQSDEMQKNNRAIFEAQSEKSNSHMRQSRLQKSIKFIIGKSQAERPSKKPLQRPK